MGREPHAVAHERRIRETVYVCDGMALGFMFGIPAASLILGSLSWSLVLASVVGWTTTIALVTGIGRWLEARGRPADGTSGCAAVDDRGLRLQES